MASYVARRMSTSPYPIVSADDTDFKLTLSPSSPRSQKKAGLLEQAQAQLSTQSWEEKHEEVLMQLFQWCVTRANSHERRGELFRSLKFLHLPLILGTVMMGSLTQFLFVESVGAPKKGKAMPVPEPATFIFMWSFLVLGITMGLLHLLDPSGRSERHLNFAGRFTDLASDISQTLDQPVRCRPLVEVTLLKSKSGYENLVRTAPGSLVGRFHLPPLNKASPVNYLAR